MQVVVVAYLLGYRKWIPRAIRNLQRHNGQKTNPHGRLKLITHEFTCKNILASYNALLLMEITNKAMKKSDNYDTVKW